MPVQESYTRIVNLDNHIQEMSLPSHKACFCIHNHPLHERDDKGESLHDSHDTTASILYRIF